jgi:NADPH:quinone reductase-like Zn-dependent oxidoreductase
MTTTRDPLPDTAPEREPPAIPVTMRAVVQDRYGSADVLRVDTIAVPVIGNDQVLVRVAAAGVDRGTWHLMTGRPYLVRLAIGLRRPRNRVPGRDLAGTVVAVGAAVTRFAVGDAVFGVGSGTFAEYAAAKETKLALAPRTLTPEQAAVVPISGLTAIQAVDKARLAAGSSVLVLGASGGVGSYAVQLAKARGAAVTGVCSTAKVDLVRSLGADHVIAYDSEDPTAPGQRYDAIIDIGGNTRLGSLRRALAPRGTLVMVGGEGGDALTGGLDRQLRARLRSLFSAQTLTSILNRENHVDLERLAALVDEDAVKPALEAVHPLEQAPSALHAIEQGRVRGKLAIRP